MYRATVKVKPAAKLLATLKACGDENGFTFNGSSRAPTFTQSKDVSLTEAREAGARLVQTLIYRGFSPTHLGVS